MRIWRRKLADARRGRLVSAVHKWAGREFRIAGQGEGRGRELATNRWVAALTWQDTEELLQEGALGKLAGGECNGS